MYAGDNNSLLDRCPAPKLEKVNGKLKRQKTELCDIYRWTPCTVCKKQERCSHVDNRIPRFQFQYRPIICVILELLKQGEGFLSLLNYINLDDRKQKKMYSDIMDSRVVGEQLGQMEILYASKYNGRSECPIMVNIVIDLNYDGAQIYKSKCSYFYPLLISILNLPPTYRKELGVGMFMLSLFTLPQG